MEFTIPTSKTTETTEPTEIIENKSSKTEMMIIGIIGSIVGGLIIYYLLKSRSSTEFSFASANVSSQIENRLMNIEQKLQQLQVQQPQQPQQQPINSINNTNTYKNNEIRKYIRDAKGRITSTEIIRNAKIE